MGEIFLLCVLFLFLCVWRIYRRLTWNLPLIGMLPSLLLNVGRIHEICTSALAKSKNATFHFQGPSFANMDMLLTANPANVHYIMTSNFHNFPKGEKFREIFDVLGDGIFNADSDSWKQQRKVARALISHSGFHRFLGKTNRKKVEKALIPVLETAIKGNRVIDLQDLFQRLTFDTSCVMITGYDPECLSRDCFDVPFSKAMDDVEEAVFARHVVPEKIWKLQRLIGVGSEKKLTRAWEVLDSVIGSYIASKRAEILISNNHREKNDKDEYTTDLLTSFMNDGDSSFDDKFLRDIVLNLMIAGRDTTSSALTWLIWLVATHPRVEAKIRDELVTILATKDDNRQRVFTVEEVKKLVYIHGAVLEALRLYPPVPFQHKEALNETILPSGHFVRPNMKVMVSLYAMGRMNSIWGEDCLDFKPERWISDGGGSIKHEPSYKFLAFNAGPRSCLGKEVALGQIKAVAATLIHNYQIRVAEGHLVAPNCSVILYMRHGLKVKVAKHSLMLDYHVEYEAEQL